MTPTSVLEDVVIVTDSLSIDGGSAMVALSSAVALARSGLRVTVFAASGQASPELAACERLRIISTDQGVALAAGNRGAGALRGLWNGEAHRRMNVLLATLDPKRTIVHVHGWTKALSSSVVASVVRAKFPLVVTLHEYFAACPNGCLYLHRDRKVCTLAPMSLACIAKNCDSRNYAFKLYRVLRQWIQRTAGRIPNGVTNYITVSPFSRRMLEPWLPGRSRYHAVDNPVDVERGPRVSAEDNGAFLFVGRLSAEKGPSLFAAAARRAGVKAVFVGEGPEREEIRRANPDAEILGWLDRAGVATQIARARLVVVPSLWYETLGLVVLEAAARGIPAIVPSGTATRDLVTHGETGLVFDRGSSGSLCEQLEMCADDAVVARLSRAAYATFWRKPPTMHTHLERLLATYHDVLGRVPAVQPVPLSHAVR